MLTSPYIFTVLLILLYFISYTQCAINKRRYCKNVKKESVTKIETQDSSELIKLQEETKEESCSFYDPGEADHHLPMQKCAIGFEDNKKIINPFQNLKQHYDINHFKSACLKCAACLAIAEHINLTFTNFYYEHTAQLQTTESCHCHVLNDLCLDGFKNYDLREYNGKRLITKASIHNKHVNSKMDGSWTKILRDLCSTYVQHMDANDILQRYKAGQINFTDYICRGDGIFRDCKNIELKQIGMSEVESVETGISISLCVNCL